jgi:hypothetical protein
LSKDIAPNLKKNIYQFVKNVTTIQFVLKVATNSSKKIKIYNSMPSDQIPFNKNNNNLSSNSVSIMYVMVPEFEIRQIAVTFNTFNISAHFLPMYVLKNMITVTFNTLITLISAYVRTANYDSC